MRRYRDPRRWLDFVCMVVGAFVCAAWLGPLGVFVGAVAGVFLSLAVFGGIFP